MHEILAAIALPFAVYGVVFVPLNIAAFIDRKGHWPRTWGEWWIALDVTRMD